MAASGGAGAKPVTIVVPIYDHWSSLEKCIAAIVEHVDTTFHKVILVNDCGPRVDAIEEMVLAAIAGQPGFEYYRNEKNLGFVGTCNRAALELDSSGNDVLLLNSDAELTAGAVEELSSVLHAAEHHGVVCARSNNATIASLPFFHRPGFVDDQTTPERDLEVFEQISPLLPRYYVGPVAVGFCFLVRRTLIDNHGLFDTVYGIGYNEENDFCMRVNALGYSSVIANRTFVRHLGSASFGDLKSDLDEKNHAILMERYPFYLDAVRTFIDYGYAASDVFAEIIASEPGSPRSILIDIHHLSLVHNGSTRYALAFLRTLSGLRKPAGVSITVAAQESAIEFFALDSYGFDVVPYSRVTGVFDVGIALAPVNHVDQLVMLNDHCARWLVSHFDMIASRSWQLMLTDPMRPLVVEQALRYADRVIALSDFSLTDAQTFYPGLAERLAERGEAVALGSTRDATVDTDAIIDAPLDPETQKAIADGGYVVIMGNFYPHKQVAKALEALGSIGVPIVAFGPLTGVEKSPTTFVLTGGMLSESQLNSVFDNAALVVFPSAYEGYGLPIADSLDFGVPVVAFDTSVAREVVKKLRAGKSVRFFSRFSDLAGIVQTALGDAALHESAAAMRGNVRGLTPYNKRMWQVALELLTEPVDPVALSRRYDAVKGLQRILDLQRSASNSARSESELARAETRAILGSRSYLLGRRVARAATPVLGVLRRVRRRS